MEKSDRIVIVGRRSGKTATLVDILVRERMTKEYEKLREEIEERFKEPARYVPNYDAYTLFLELIDNHIKELSNEESKIDS